MVEIEEYRALAKGERRALFLFAFSWAPLSPAQVRRLAEDEPSFKVRKNSVVDVCRTLDRRNLIQTARKEGFVLQRQIPFELMRELVYEADEQGWWPDLNARTRSYSANAKFCLSMVERDSALRDLLQAELFAMLVRGSSVPSPKAAEYFQKLSKGKTDEIVRGAVAQAVCSMGDVPSVAFTVGSELTDSLLADYLSLAFHGGRNVKGVLASLAAAFEFKSHFPGRALAENYLALCVWMGEASWLDRPGLARYADFVSACKAVLAGDCAAADKMFRKIVEGRNRPNDFDNEPVRLLMATVCATANPKKFAKTRPPQLIMGGLGSAYMYQMGTGANHYARLPTEYARFYRECWKQAGEDLGGILSRFDVANLSSAVLALPLAWNWHLMPVGRARHLPTVKGLLLLFDVAARNGYLNLAGLGLSLLVGAYKDEDVGGILDEMKSRGTWLLPREEPEPEWKAVLGQLRNSLVKIRRDDEAKVSSDSGKRIVWSLSIDDYGDNRFEITDIAPYLRVVGADPVTKGERLLDVHKLNAGRYEALLTEGEKALAAQINANVNPFYRDNLEVNETILALLCGLPNLERYEEICDRWGNPVRRSVTPIVFEKVSCQMESRIAEDGGVDLFIPSEILTARESFVIRKVKGEERYQYVPITPAVKRIVKVFDAIGDKGHIILPREGAAAATDVLESLASVIPFAGPSAEDVADLPRVAAQTDLAMRLDYDETDLTIRGVVLPVAENSSVAMDPGKGLAEKVVTTATGSYLLVRDLAAEREKFSRVVESLAAFGDWFDGTCTWRIGDLAQALDALVALKALDPAVPLEWIDQRRLDVASAPKSGVALESSRTAEEWFSVKGSFTLDNGRVLNVLDVLAGMPSRAGRYVRLSDGAFVALTKSMVREMEALAAAGRRKGGALDVPRAALPMLDKAFDATDEDAVPLPEVMAKSASEIRSVLARRPTVPGTLQAELRPYQLDGYRWLSRLAACGFGSCLADDMGLGKTLQIIALLLERSKDGPSLVVAPASVCGNWRREIRRFAPTLVPLLAMERDDSGTESRPGDVVIASYGYLLFHEEELVKCAWNGLVLDEAQAIKNDASKRAHLVKRFSARFRVAATGTPVENRLGELWSLFDFLNPGLLGPAASFAQRFVQNGKASSELKKLVKPLILRRLKGEVLDDLPEKTEITLSVNLGKDERSAYEGCRLHALASLETKDEDDRISILAELTRLRRFCCHPSLVLGKSDLPSAKMEALVDLLGELHEGHHRALVFSQFTDYLSLVRRVVETHGWTCKYLDGTTPTRQRERLVEEFQRGDGDFFLISLKAGGTGLNLTAANYVILLDPWWNPAVENQAADRAHRIGQTQPVTIYRLVSVDTVEERVIELHKEKNAMAADLLEGTSNTSFTSKDLLNLFR